MLVSRLSQNDDRSINRTDLADLPLQHGSNATAQRYSKRYSTSPRGVYARGLGQDNNVTPGCGFSTPLGDVVYIDISW